MGLEGSYSSAGGIHAASNRGITGGLSLQPHEVSRNGFNFIRPRTMGGVLCVSNVPAFVSSGNIEINNSNDGDAETSNFNESFY